MHATNVGDNVSFTWLSDNGVHEGFIPLQWLKQNCYSEEALDKKKRGAQPTVAPKVTITLDNLLLFKHCTRVTFLKLLITL